jgi:DNA-directed RNA polymerase subunit RPC12/RpoP
MRADVTCLNCGRDLGEIEQAEGGMRLRRRGAQGHAPRVRGGRLICERCGGRAMLQPVMDIV